MINLENKVVLITGGSRGIGAACVKLFCQANAKVIFTFKNDVNAAAKLVNQIEENSPFGIRMSLDSEANIKLITQRLIKEFKRIDILINNAGIWKFGEADKMSLHDWEETLKINLTGTFLVTREVLKSMKKNKFGRIINISSTAGQRGEAFYSHYAASKGGMISFTKSLAVEFGKFNITTNCVAPGWVLTDMSKDVLSNKEYRKEVENGIPLRRIAKAEDIAGPTLFLASDFAKHINGEILNVNGGSVLIG
ncbi:MAG: 3-oxoacyl-ACP reductase FabG [Chlorobiaceae bacterium]|nr:3-oxoacyl-ACP reductase FabG [Chlorobiaceae bacterium]MBA4309994.1 3-oxoacyl-ACP reductase FabG [Chlorobiaceae bacterium]